MRSQIIDASNCTLFFFQLSPFKLECYTDMVQGFPIRITLQEVFEVTVALDRSDPPFACYIFHKCATATVLNARIKLKSKLG